jgi:hypothetical protein
MPYADHFKLTDGLIKHLDPVFAALNDPFIESRYTGFLAVSSVTVLELAMKTIFCEFAATKHKVLANFCSNYFENINGRIGLDKIKKDYLPKFGKKYQQRFEKALEKLERHHLKNSHASPKSSYGNLLTWRNEFAHQGTISANASYLEVKRSYSFAKEIMNCLAGCMRR